jgi:predicted TPR repeat methyltransferase
MGDREQALEHMREAGRLDPANPQTQYLLAALGDGPMPERADSQYVASLFDAYASTFDNDLVSRLKYNIPEEINEALARADLLGTGLDVLDIGCGTGLCGPLFRAYARRLVGVDLAPKMIEAARARGVYDELVVGDVIKPMKDGKSQFSHVVGADVFPYIGDLNEVFDAVSTALTNNGVFAFSVESTETYPFELHSKARYAHSERYLRELADKFGFEVVLLEDTVVRTDKGEPVKGFVVLLRQRLAQTPDAPAA